MTWREATAVHEVCSAPVFFALFGVLFLWFGAQRLFKLSAEPNGREALVWGSIGIMIGLGFLWMAAWFFRGDPAETERQLMEIQTRRPY
jgi:hypothetical protein